MKKITFLMTLLTISLGFGQNLVVNGDFETGSSVAGWNQGVTGGSYGTDAVIGADVVGAGTTHSGDYAGRALNWGTGATSFLQGVNVTPGETYIVNFWFTFSDFTPTTNVVIRNFTGDVAQNPNLTLTPIVPDNGRNAVSDVNYGCGIANQDPSYAWKEAKFSFTVPAGVTKVRFQYYNGNVGYYKYIDDVSIVLDATASLKDLAQFNFNAYPNPAKDAINLSASKNIDKIEIYSLLGQQVLTKELNSKNANINVSSLAKGVYVVKAQIEDAVGSYKFIKE